MSTENVKVKGFKKGQKRLKEGEDGKKKKPSPLFISLLCPLTYKEVP